MLFFGHIGITLAFVFFVFLFLKENFDYRYVIVGSMLPDIIDKPIGHVLFYDTFGNGRIFCHTLLFIALLTILAIYLNRKYSYTGFGFMALGAVCHIAEDQMWLAQKTLFWPLFGLEFPKYEYGDYIGYLLQGLINNPQTYIPEITGIMILGIFVYKYRLFEFDILISFLKTGTLTTEKIQHEPVTDRL